MPEFVGDLKLHEGCGGMVQWVEAIMTPGVGFYGECMHCTATKLSTEDILPFRSEELHKKFREKQIKKRHRKQLAELEWEDDAGWEENQQRLQKELKTILNQ